MVTVTFLSSTQGYQEGRVAEIAKRLRADHPEWTVQVLPPDASQGPLMTHKLKFGPAVLVDETIEFVGIPRYRMLVERIAMVAAGKTSPRTAAPPAAPVPAKPAAPAAKLASAPEPGS